MQASKVTTHRSGTVAVVGRPNVGKSTLINACVGEKVSAVSNKPQTTRNAIRGILTTEAHQIVFLDTPGIHKPRNRLQGFMVQSAVSALNEADLICFVADASAGLTREDILVLERIAALGRPKVALVNKVDLVSKEKLLPVIGRLHEEFGFADIVPVSALQKDGVDAFLGVCLPHLPEGAAMYDAELYTDITERFLVAEVIREKAFHQLDEEIPYGIAVQVEEFKEEGPQLYVNATIIVEKDNHKRIVVGAGGRMIKRIGTDARRELKKLLDKEAIFLELFVKVSENWTERASMLQELGYTE